MRGKNVVKICCIAGFILGEIYMVLVMAAPNRPTANESRMWIPRESIPRPQVAPVDAKPPTSVIVKRILIGSIFMGPFGALAGLGVGLLLEGLRQKIWGRGEDAPQPPK